jgi:RNA polymerase sigma factor (sigma-70 family)
MREQFAEPTKPEPLDRPGPEHPHGAGLRAEATGRPDHHQSPCSDTFSPEENRRFYELDREYRPWAMAFAASRGARFPDAEDAVNTALCKAMLRFEPARGSKFKTFLAFILNCELANVWRRFCQDVEVLVPLDAGIDPIDEAECERRARREAKELLDLALGQLPEEDRQILLWRYDNELTYEEISQRA